MFTDVEKLATAIVTADPVCFAEKLVMAITANQADLCLKQPDWWQAVLVQLHDRLADTYLLEGEYGDRHLTRIERRTLGNWLEQQAQGYRLNPDGAAP